MVPSCDVISPCKAFVGVRIVALLLGRLINSVAALTLKTQPALEIKSSTTVLGRLVLRRNTSQPFSICLTQRSNDAPWLRLMMRLDGNEVWEDMRDKMVRQVAYSEENALPSTDISLSQIGSYVATNESHSKRIVTGVIVRDPVTRLVSNYINSCRTEGLWEQCFSKNSQVPISFETMISALGQVDMDNVGPLFKQQKQLCNLRDGVDIIGQYEQPAAAANEILSSVGLWQDYGERGWGEMRDARFSDLFVDDGAEEKVCDFFTPELLHIVRRVYQDDYAAFENIGYNTSSWHERCADKWNVTSEQGAVLASQALPSSGVQSLSYMGASGCTATRTEIGSLSKMPGQQASNNTKEAFTFYLHDKGAFNFSEVLHCFLQSRGINLETDNWDDHVYANVSEHLGEVWLLQALQTHPQRTKIASKAQVHIVAALPFVSYAATIPGPNGITCSRLTDHIERMSALSHAMTSLSAFKKSSGRNFFIFTTHYRVNDVYTASLLEVLERGNVMVGTADKEYTHWNPYPKIKRKILLPYKAHYKVESSAHSISSSNVSGERRSIDFLFRGKISRANEGNNRKAMWGLANKSLHAVEIQDVSFYNEPPRFSGDLASAYLNSRFCFTPAGDTPTSRRLFDALAAGCVPLALGSFERLVDNLPFWRTIDWNTIILFSGSLQCVAHDDGRTTRWLDFLASTGNLERRNTMSSAGRDVFRNTLSYALNGQSVATALLRELQYDLVK